MGGQLFRNKRGVFSAKVMTIVWRVPLYNIRKIDVNIRNCQEEGETRGREGTVLWDSFYDLWQSCVLLCVYVMRDPRAFTRAAIASIGGGSRGRGGREAEAVTLSPVSELRSLRNFRRSSLSKFCKSVPRARIKCFPPPSSTSSTLRHCIGVFENRNFGAAPHPPPPRTGAMKLR